MNGARCVYAHISFIVFTSNAASLPPMVDRVLYVTTPSNSIAALDAETATSCTGRRFQCAGSGWSASA